MVLLFCAWTLIFCTQFLFGHMQPNALEPRCVIAQHMVDAFLHYLWIFHAIHVHFNCSDTAIFDDHRRILRKKTDKSIESKPLFVLIHFFKKVKIKIRKKSLWKEIKIGFSKELFLKIRLFAFGFKSVTCLAIINTLRSLNKSHIWVHVN